MNQPSRDLQAQNSNQDSQVQDSQVRNSQVQDSQVQDPQVEESEAGETAAADDSAKPAHPRFAKPQRVAFVQSAWHPEVVAECRTAFLAEAEARHIPRAAIDIFEVPGAFEIPLHAQLIAKTRRYTAIVAAGLVINDEHVAETVIKALMDVQLRTEVPVFSAVLTPEQFQEKFRERFQERFQETSAHFEFFRKHFAANGIQVAKACANTLLSLERLRGQVAAGIVPNV
ncbi:6,7-dimethyl-8-ribityllumazine synthase [Bradyrhizobium sp.]|uniref:6,7-dimethyl-8-ribityllumazine synthase n=1 Tax=Bradyrhizobium sp. TaxID=376 RepID=UPI003C6A72A3